MHHHPTLTGALFLAFALASSPSCGGDKPAAPPAAPVLKPLPAVRIEPQEKVEPVAPAPAPQPSGKRFEPKVEPKAPPGVVRGFVRYAGTPPPPETVATDKDPACAVHGPKVKPGLAVDASGGIAGVFVEIEGGKGSRFATANAEATVDQKGCEFIPHLTVIPPDGKVRFLNSDPTPHNVHLFAVKNTVSNQDSPPGGEQVLSFPYPERIAVICDRHPWMSAKVIVTANPYHALSGPDGSFSIDGLEPGSYTIYLWQETLGAKRFEISLAPEHGAEVEVLWSK